MTQDNHKTERIAKRIARAGLCSRRDAESWIIAGRVRLNGDVLDSPAVKVGAQDQIEVDGKLLPLKQRSRLFLYHKPPGLLTTHKDEKGRETIFDRLPKELPRVVSVGRLDLNTEGLLLLTNDGELSRYLELPATGWKRKYRVRVFGHINEDKLADLKNGITIDGIRYKTINAVLDKAQGHNSWLTMTLAEGKNREIRRVMEALDMKVNRLIRTSYGPFNLGNLKTGAVEEIKEPVMKQQIPKFFRKGTA